MKRVFHTCLAVLFGGLMLLTAAPATHATVIGDDTFGFVGSLFGTLPTGGFTYNVASDGEGGFDPFGAGFDTSDGIQLPDAFAWRQVAGGQWTFVGSDGTESTWVLPANLSAIGCGVENEPTCEPVGHFISPVPWNAGFTGGWVITDADGVSDVILTFNDAAGNANILFASDPIPEPTSLALLGAGLIGLAAMRRRRHA